MYIRERENKRTRTNKNSSTNLNKILRIANMSAPPQTLFTKFLTDNNTYSKQSRRNTTSCDGRLPKNKAGLEIKKKFA